MPQVLSNQPGELLDEELERRLAAEGWSKTEEYCRWCGCQPLYVEPGVGDYYAGPDYRCCSCGERFTMG